MSKDNQKEIEKVEGEIVDVCNNCHKPKPCKCGRPSKYSVGLGTEIAKRISKGESIKRICKADDMPSPATIFTWLLDEDKKVFLDQYEKAMNAKAEMMFDELLEIADKEGKDVMRARLRIDTRKWYLSKVLPKKFGEKLDLTSGGDKIGGAIDTKRHPEDIEAVKAFEKQLEDNRRQRAIKQAEAKGDIIKPKKEVKQLT